MDKMTMTDRAARTPETTTIAFATAVTDRAQLEGLLERKERVSNCRPLRENHQPTNHISGDMSPFG